MIYIFSIKDDLKGVVAPSNLRNEIMASPIKKAIDTINIESDNVTIKYKEELDGFDLNFQLQIIDAHDGLKSDSTQTPQIVEVHEDSSGTGGKPRTQSFTFDIATDTKWQIFPISFPFPVAIMRGFWINKSDCEGDCADFGVFDIPIGTLGSNIAMNTTILPVNQSVITNANIGDYLKIQSGENIDDCGRIIEIDHENLTIKVETKTTRGFTSGSLMLQSTKLADNYCFQGNNVLVKLDGSIGSKLIPANVPISLKYLNTNATTKKFILNLEVLY